MRVFTSVLEIAGAALLAAAAVVAFGLAGALAAAGCACVAASYVLTRGGSA